MSLVTILERYPLTERVIAVLAEQLGEYPVGWGAVPRVEGEPASPPYVIVYPLWGTTSGPPLAAPDADVAWVYQVTMVALRGDQLEWLRDRVVSTFLKRVEGGFAYPLDVSYVDDEHPGIHVMGVAMSDASGEPSDDGPLTQDVLRFTLDCTPAGPDDN